MNSNNILPREDEEDEQQCSILPCEDDDESLMAPDHDLISQNSSGVHDYDRRTPFAYILRPLHLEFAVISFLDDILEDADFLKTLHQLKSAIQDKDWILDTALGFSLVVRLIADCPVSSDHESKWVQFSVGILAHADDIDKKNPNLFINYLRPALAVIDRVCADISDVDFELGLGKLIDSFMEIEDSWEIIINHGDGIKTLSFILCPIDSLSMNSLSVMRKDKLFSRIMRLWATEDGLRKPRLSQAVASLVWPMRWWMSMTQYLGFLKTISSILHRQDLANFMEDSLEFMTREGLVSRVFDVLKYVTLPDELKQFEVDGWVSRSEETTNQEQENLVIMMCFEILSNLSSITIGRLEIVRVIAHSRYLEAFYDAISRTAIPEHGDTHLVPALTSLLNILEYTRYTGLVENAEGPGYQ